jgi:branched-chain amino acid transport system permease protein
MEYALHVLIIALCYAVLALSLDLLAGQTGLLALSHAAFFGLGAYTSALLAIHSGAPFLLGVVAGMLVATFVSLVVSLPSLRLRGDYFAIATFGFQMILYSVFNNWSAVTGGSIGIAGIPQATLFGITIQTRLGYALLTCMFATLAFAIAYRVVNAPFGRVLRAVREDEPFATALGKNTLRFKVTVFALSAGLAACAGSLYGYYNSYIDPSTFTVLESILIVSMVILGGAGSMWGPLVGAAVLVSLPEALRFVGLPTGAAANLRQIIYGALLVVMMMARPQGLVGRYAFGR